LWNYLLLVQTVYFQRPDWDATDETGSSVEASRPPKWLAPQWPAKVPALGMRRESGRRWLVEARSLLVPKVYFTPMFRRI
jgi:hypothetical protein